MIVMFSNVMELLSTMDDFCHVNYPNEYAMHEYRSDLPGKKLVAMFYFDPLVKFELYLQLKYRFPHKNSNTLRFIGFFDRFFYSGLNAL